MTRSYRALARRQGVERPFRLLAAMTEAQRAEIHLFDRLDTAGLEARAIDG